MVGEMHSNSVLPKIVTIPVKVNNLVDGALVTFQPEMWEVLMDSECKVLAAVIRLDLPAAEEG